MAKKKKKNPRSKEIAGTSQQREPKPRTKKTRLSTTTLQYNFIQPYILWMVIIFIASPALVGPYGQRGGYTPDLHMAAYVQVVSLFLLVLFFANAYIKRIPITIPDIKGLIPLGLFYLWAMLSITWAHSRYEALVDALDWTGAFLAGALILLTIKDMRQVRLVLMMLYISGLLISLLGIGQYLFGIDWVQQHIVPGTTFSNKNMSGQYAVLTIFLGFGLLLHEKSRPMVWFYAIGSALIVVFMIYTRSRGAWLAAITALVVFVGILLYWRWIEKRNIFSSPEKIMALFCGVLIIFVMVTFTPNTFGFGEQVNKASIGTKDAIYKKEHGLDVLRAVTDGVAATAHIRYTMWLNSIPMWIDNFFVGVGLGNWTIHYAKYQSWYKQDTKLVQNQYHANAHNDYVEILCELGIIGFILFLWALVAIFKTIKRVMSNKDEETFCIVMIGPAIAIFGIGVNAIFSFPLKQPIPIFMILIYVCLFFCVAGIRDNKSQILEIPKARIAFILFFFMASITVWQYQLYQSELRYREAVIKLKGKVSQKNYRQSLVASRAAYDYNPLRKRLLWLQGTALLKLGNKEKALEKLIQVLDTYPYNDSAIINIVSSYAATGELHKGLYYLEQIRSVQRGQHSVESAYLKIIEQLGLHSQIIEISEESIKKAKKHLHVSKILIKKLKEKYEKDESAKTHRKIVHQERRISQFTSSIEKHKIKIAKAKKAQVEQREKNAMMTASKS